MNSSELGITNYKSQISKLPQANNNEAGVKLSYLRRTQNESTIEDLERKTILIVDDKLENLRLLSTILTEKGYRVRKALNGEIALKTIQAAPPDIILLDIKMPGMDGYEVCQRLKLDANTYEIPVIFLSANNASIDRVKAFKVGGIDYISKPIESEEVLVRIQNQLDIQSAKAKVRQLNEELEQRVIERTAQLKSANQELEKEIIKRQKIQQELEQTNEELKKEINQREQIQAKLLRMALKDDLTSLPNRAFLMKQLERATSRAQKDNKYSYAVLFLDCDRFKVINDSLGHTIGDKLLIAVADRLKYCLPEATTISRLGGDEFIVFLDEIENTEKATTTAEKIHQVMKLPFQIREREIFINVSIGIVLGDRTYCKPENLLRDADTAMYRAKEEGKGRYRVFEKNMHARAEKIMELETDLRRSCALSLADIRKADRQEFELHYQPIVDLKNGKLSGFEALIRWNHPEKGRISPGEFIPIAEETGSIVQIGIWALRQACSQLKQWQQENISSQPLTISVNLSVKQFAQPDLIEQIDLILAETQIEGHNLKLEITESAIVDNNDLAIDILQQLKNRGIKLLIDDFGTGYSCLSYLHRFPIDTLKIDRSFISRISDSGENIEIVKAIIKLAHDLNMSVVAEGIETENQLDRIQKLGCEFGQGYFFSKPLDKNAAGAMVFQSDSF
ncbi:MAG: EAL domain-containing protein [Prochloraceae cyanobacterium]